MGDIAVDFAFTPSTRPIFPKMLGINIPFVIQKIEKKPLKEAVESGSMIIRRRGGVSITF